MLLADATELHLLSDSSIRWDECGVFGRVPTAPAGSCRCRQTDGRGGLLVRCVHIDELTN
jgi:hypothetical protein